MKFKLEICADSVESATIAQIAGADRIELCDNLTEGGTTPSFGMIASARNILSIPLNVIIRPRGGDFLYSDEEFDIMRRDIDLCGEAGADGIVIGILREDGSIDTEKTAKLTELARPMSVTFHRAFDMCADPVKGLEEVISAGPDRLLSSGQGNNAAEGSKILQKLVRQSRNRIIVMPGGGLNESNISEVAKATGAVEFHLTGRKDVDSQMVYRKENIHLGGFPSIPEYSRKVADPQKIINIINILKMI